jgi:hypothetical protein
MECAQKKPEDHSRILGYLHRFGLCTLEVAVCAELFVIDKYNVFTTSSILFRSAVLLRLGDDWYPRSHNITFATQE